MKKTANIIYLIFGAIMPILVGSLHTSVHFQDLTSGTVRAMLDEPIMVMGEQQIAYNTWGLMSFMMGFSFIIIGLLHFALQRSRGWDKYPSLFGCVVIMLYLGGVLYAASTFHATPQFYGGIVGIAMMVICMSLSIIGAKKEVG